MVLFDSNQINRSIIENPEYIIIVDVSDKDLKTYCFGMVNDGVFEILLSKVIEDSEEFEQEVSNLTKYFNAKRI
jgi:hypothetical protein